MRGEVSTPASAIAVDKVDRSPMGIATRKLTDFDVANYNSSVGKKTDHIDPKDI